MLQVICDVLNVDPYYLISGAKMNESVHAEYTVVYHDNEEYQILVEYRKMSDDSRKRLAGYAKALLDMEGKR